MDPALESLTLPSVSVVVATYDRPIPLRVAIASAFAQTVVPLEIIVIGDACDERTGTVLGEFEKSIRYINLANRHGEQAVPNSAGSAIATGDVVAYLNHDDVWLPHHLETALAEMDRSGRRWHIGSAAFSGSPPAGADDGPLAFTDRTVPGRSVAAAFTKVNAYIEPVSSWVVDAAALREIGWWRPARDLYRTPTQDLALRMWRRFGEPSFSDQITVLKPAKQRRPPKGCIRPPTYAGDPIGYAWLAELVARAEGDGGDAILRASELVAGPSRPRHASISADPAGATPRASRWAGRLVGPGAARLYRCTGVDLLDVVYRLFRTPRGVRLNRLLRNRTGEKDLPSASVDAAIAEARAAVSD